MICCPESRTVPSRYEVEAFRGRVDTLRDDVARLEARLAAFERELDAEDGR